MAPDRSDRHHTKAPDDDQRGPFEIDRDRILYCLAFRRLAGVTQVVHAAEGHVFHNRLTHSLKVAQVGRRLAEHINRDQKDAVAELGGVSADVVETACLAHDLGHPPFGHVAETELDLQLVRKEIPDGFEGNAQSFRVLTKVATRRTESRGLDLTRATLNAVLKYPWSRGVDGKEHDKWGHYYSETEDFVFARELMPAADKRQSPEAALMDWADDISYAVHDADDFYRAGIVPLDQLLADTPERGRFLGLVFDKWQEKGKITGNRSDHEQQAQDFFERMRKAVLLFAPVILEPFAGTRGQQAGLSWFASLLLKRYIVGTDKGRSVTVGKPDSNPMITIDPELRREVDLLKEIMAHYVFEHPALVAQQYGQRRVIGDLFEILFGAAAPDSKNQGLIPEPFREEIRTGAAKENSRERARVVADLIGSLTEQQALVLHRRLTGAAPGSVRDLITR